MFKKEKEDPYFSAFIASADSACKAAKLLHDTLTHFDAGVLPQRLEEIHAIEHGADDIKHHTMSALGQGVPAPHRAGGYRLPGPKPRRGYRQN